MERDEKITEIIEMFRKNITGLGKTKRRPEHKSMLFCLFIGDKLVGVDIQNSFIDNKTLPEIESHFSERHIYHSILNDKMCDHDGVFVHPNNPICREMFL